MRNLDIAKRNYERGLWSAEMLEALKEKGKLTQEEVDEIKENSDLEE